LALVTCLQFAEGLSDRQAADAVRSRIDWKYALTLPLDDLGFDDSVLSEFRMRPIATGAKRFKSSSGHATASLARSERSIRRRPAGGAY
jgi:hypothetical protein